MMMFRSQDEERRFEIMEAFHTIKEQYRQIFDLWAPLKIPSTNLITSTSQITFNNEIKTSIKKHPRAS